MRSKLIATIVWGEMVETQQNSGDIIKTLKSKGLRVTPQRFAVYANLRSRSDHPTAEQIWTELNQDYPVSSQATIYAALQSLREVGLIQEVLLESGVSRYDANMDKHHHFRCRCCGAIEDIPWSLLSAINLQVLRPGLVGENYEVTVKGVCDKCSEQENHTND